MSLSKKLFLIMKSANDTVQSMLLPYFKKEFSDKSHYNLISISCLILSE